MALACGGGGGAPQEAPGDSGAPQETARDRAMTLAAFLAQRPAGPTAVRLHAKFQGHLPGEDERYEVALTSLDTDPSAFCVAELSRKEEVGRQLHEAVKDGARHALVVELRPAAGMRAEVVRLVGPAGRPSP